jgi:NAD(P)-dependent dehydrogenase (short-subunit alcohol dehydrogenase family)
MSVGEIGYESARIKRISADIFEKSVENQFNLHQSVFQTRKGDLYQLFEQRSFAIVETDSIQIGPLVHSTGAQAHNLGRCLNYCLCEKSVTSNMGFEEESVNYFENKIAIVTGGASGIGRALCEELGRRGTAAVTVADINDKGAQEVASVISAGGGQAQAMHVDVSRSEDVQKLVDKVTSRHGRLDLMFNNAGITMCGEVRDVDLELWQRMLDVNLWGVIYGTTAAYRVMVKQGFGHIVNTASLDGLTPMPMATPYTAAKHAVVGLSTALRLEAANLGVKVSVACPGAVQSGIFDTATYAGVKREDVIAEISSGFKMVDAADCARAILRGVERNKAVIIDATHNRLFWWLYRLSPTLYSALMREGVKQIRALRQDPLARRNDNELLRHYTTQRGDSGR